jgi:TrmH family RNA methyltransferase
MGAHFRLAIHEQADLVALARTFPGQVIALALDAATSLWQVDLSQPTLFVLGNEGAGLSGTLLEAASKRVVIPMPGGMESLNVAAAAAICLFERVRQCENAGSQPRP